MMIMDINLDYLGYGVYGIALLAFTLWALMNADKYGRNYWNELGKIDSICGGDIGFSRVDKL